MIYIIGIQQDGSLAATYDELYEQGYIDKDKLYFEKGLLFSIEDTAIINTSFIFNASKWRSGLGAYFLMTALHKLKMVGLYHRCRNNIIEDRIEISLLDIRP